MNGRRRYRKSKLEHIDDAARPGSFARFLLGSLNQDSAFVGEMSARESRYSWRA